MYNSMVQIRLKAWHKKNVFTRASSQWNIWLWCTLAKASHPTESSTCGTAGQIWQKMLGKIKAEMINAQTHVH